MKLKNEKQLLFIIRYILFIFILLISIIITTFLYFENKSTFEKIKQSTEEKFISDKKKIIKEQIDNLYDYIISEQKDTENNLKESLISRVHEAHTIISNIYNQYKDTHTKEELTLLIRTAIKDIRFNNNRGYFFVYDKKAVNIIHPLVPQLEGKDLINHQDTKGTFVLRDSLDLLKSNSEAYQEWYWRKSKTDFKEYRKIGFVKNIYELDWFIGTGEYVEDFSKDIQKKVLKQINKLKFGENSYFIVTDKDNNYLSHINKDLIGKNAFKKIKNVSDKNNLKHIEDVIKKGEGFVSLEFYKPNSNLAKFKIIYLKTIPGWDWVISTGFYQDDVDVLINEERDKLIIGYERSLKNLFIISFILTIVLLAISFYISYLIELKFKKYKESIQSHIEENKKQYELLSQKSKLSAMGEMIQNIAHQWRQPLSLITTHASAIKLKKEMNDLDDNFLYDSLDNIGYTANHLSDTIEDFRDFFRPDKEKFSFSLEVIINKVFKLLSSQIKGSNIHIIENIEDITIKNYERELLQVLLNIIKNAIDALNDKDKEMKKYIFIDIYKNDENVIIEIKDNANGIKEEILTRIFEPYFTTKHKSQGTGIGLYMSQEIITRHMKGSLEVSNSSYTYEETKHIGAVFKITLPLS